MTAGPIKAADGAPADQPVGDEADRPTAPQAKRPGDTGKDAPHGAFAHEGHGAGERGEPRSDPDDILSQPGGHRDAVMDRANRPPSARRGPQ